MGTTVNTMAMNNLQQKFLRLNATSNLSPTKSAKDDAAGLSIAEKLTAAIRGLEQGSANTADMNHLVRTAEGALSTVSDRLQRVNELTLRAQNGIHNANDRAIFQNEVNQILEDVFNTVQNTAFNNKNLLDGSFADKNTASGADGTGMQVTISNMSLDSLGLNGFSVSDPNALEILTQAIATVAQERSDLGAISNTFQHTINSNDITALNQQAARSRIIDTDYAKEATEAKKERALEEYRMNMRQTEMQRHQQSMRMLLL